MPVPLSNRSAGRLALIWLLLQILCAPSAFADSHAYPGPFPELEQEFEQEAGKVEDEAKSVTEAAGKELGQAETGEAGVATDLRVEDAASSTGKPRMHKNGQSLTAQASDPTAPLIQMQVTNFYAPSNHNADSYSNLLNFQPVIPVAANDIIPWHQVMRFTVPVLTTPKPNRETGLGDISYFDIFVPGAEDWGIWGAGFTAVAPTASDDELGAGKFQLGPAFTAMYYKKKNWQIGTVVQNPVSFAGEGNRDDVAVLQIQPVINYIHGDWYFGAGDFNITWDWKENEATIPVAFQTGKIQQIGKYKYNLSAEIAWTAVHPDDTVTPRWGIRLGFVWLLPES